MDRADLDEAIEQAAFLPGKDDRAIATTAQVDRLRDQLRRLLDEIPEHVTALELRELLEPDAGEPADDEP